MLLKEYSEWEMMKAKLRLFSWFYLFNRSYFHYGSFFDLWMFKGTNPQHLKATLSSNKLWCLGITDTAYILKNQKSKLHFPLSPPPLKKGKKGRTNLFPTCKLCQRHWSSIKTAFTSQWISSTSSKSVRYIIIGL
mgnify:CR=1 FL=1